MASNTTNLGLLKKDPILDRNDTFNIQTMLNDNWDKIDADSKVKADNISDLAGVGRTTETVKKNADDIKVIKEGTLSFTNLETVNKTLTGAINELKAKDDSLSTQMAENVKKPTTAIGKNIPVFDTNQDKLKDSGKSIGRSSGKILELPTGLVTGDILRVGTTGEVERLPKGVDGQVLGYCSGLPIPIDIKSGAWEKIVSVILLSNTTQIDFIIPQDYKYLKILMKAKGTDTTDRILMLKFNNSITTDYEWGSNVNNAQITSSATAIKNINKTYHTLLDIDINNSNDNYKYVKSTSLNTSESINGRRNNNEEISVISMWLNSGSFVSNSEFILLGVK